MGMFGADEERVTVREFSDFINFDNEIRLQVLIRLELRENREV